MKKIFFKITFIFLIFTLIPLSIYADDELFDEILDTIETSNLVDEIPDINARHAVIIDRSSRQIIYGKSEKEQCKMASTTKIMTCIIVLENANLHDTIIVSSKSAGTGGSRLGLSTNDDVTVENLLYGLMLRSGNDAAVALAEHVGGSIEGFATLMNKKAHELGLSSTHFVTPHGLDNDEHYTTAFDLAILTDYALKNETFAKIVNTKTITISINGYSKTISNTNELLGNLNGVYGVKTGFTNGANRCLVTACKRGDLDIICVVLGCDTKKNRTQDSVKLINYAFNNFSMVNIDEFIINNFNEWYLLHSCSFTINKGSSQILELYIDSADFPYSRMAVKNTDIDNINTYISFNPYFEAPLPSGMVIGNLAFKINDLEYFSIDIMNSNIIDKKNSFDYFSCLMKNYCNYFYNLNS